MQEYFKKFESMTFEEVGRDVYTMDRTYRGIKPRYDAGKMYLAKNGFEYKTVHTTPDGRLVQIGKASRDTMDKEILAEKYENCPESREILDRHALTRILDIQVTEAKNHPVLRDAIVTNEMVPRIIFKNP